MRGNAGSRQDARRPNRRSIRLPGYDYSRAGAYFVTICTKDRECLFCDIVNREMSLNNAGRMVDKWCGELENKFPDIKCDKYIIMPNHFHAIIQNAVGADLRVCPDLLIIGRRYHDKKISWIVAFPEVQEANQGA